MYLIKKETYFYDPHGSPDLGGVEYEVTDDTDYNGLKEHVRYISSEYDYENDGYDENGEEVLYTPVTDKMEERFYGEDGYNCEVTFYYVKEISLDDAVEYSNIIDGFNSLKTLFI